MKSLNLTRIVMGIIVFVGLLFFKPLAYFAAAMMIFAGLTGICFLEKLLSKVGFSSGASCSTAANPAADLQRMTPEEIKQAVKEKYSEVASNPQAKFNFPVGRKFAESVGYSSELLDKLPASMWESFTGAGNPQPYIDIKRGEKILDLGCGAGLDLYLYAQATGPEGQVYGVDISEDMIAKTRRNMETLNVQNVEFLCAPADSMPLPDGSVDLVAVNGIYNLSPDKTAVMREVARVLRPGGRTIFAEIVLKAPLPEEIRKNINDWFRCIGGALPQNDFLELLSSEGFSNPRILWTGRNARTGHELALCAVIRAEKSNIH
ncbi:MAG: methyltransferase domain-containing protein [Planctomycetes bacterium]|nr:methyltransferase domain-containing protein [Planctomycetota bacterium]MCH8120579.1 methyltransferase domain-containing protein [Planctomycetota bacterium]